MQRHGILPCVLVYSWNPEPRREAIISVLADSSSWAHPSSPPSPDTSHLHKISRWFLSPAVLINLRWGPRYYQVDKPCPLSPIQIPGPQNLYHEIFCIRRTWVWASSRSWWSTGEPGILQFMGWQRVGHNWATELTENLSIIKFAGWHWLLGWMICVVAIDNQNSWVTYMI